MFFKAILYAFLVIVTVPGAVQAQQPSEGEAQPLIAGWQSTPPFFEVSDGEQPSGAVADSTVLIA